jgi:hypothetical protein
MAKILFRVHALQRMFERRVSNADVRAALESGEAIEDYPKDTPYPSQLLLAWIKERHFMLWLLGTRRTTKQL